MAKRSKMITAKEASSLNQYKISKVSESVNSGSIDINDAKANECYNNIMNDYRKIIQGFKDVKAALSKSKAHLHGQNLIDGCSRAVRKCQNQIDSVRSRRNDFQKSFDTYYMVKDSIEKLNQNLGN